MIYKYFKKRFADAPEGASAGEKVIKDFVISQFSPLSS